MSDEVTDGGIPVIRLCVLGDGNVGKSALTIRYFQDQFVEDWDPTIEDLYVKKDQIDSIFFQLEVQDTAGQEQFALLREEYIRRSDGFIIVYSVAQQPPTDDPEKTSFKNVSRYYDDIRQFHGEDVPILIAANKIDLRRTVNQEQGEALANRLKLKYIETSAKTKHNVTEAFQSLCEVILRRRPQPQPTNRTDDDTSSRQKEKIGCKCTLM